MFLLGRFDGAADEEDGFGAARNGVVVDADRRRYRAFDVRCKRCLDFFSLRAIDGVEDVSAQALIALAKFPVALTLPLVIDEYIDFLDNWRGISLEGVILEGV